ncbi:MAG: rod shape-determining protein MreC [Vicinamibacterales bacterium]
MLSSTRRTLSLLTMLCVGHVLLISAQVQTGTGMPVLESAAFGAFSRIQRATAAVADAVGGLWGHYFALSGAARENDELRRRVLELEAELQAARARNLEVRSLEQLLAVRDALPTASVTARVIAGSPEPGTTLITIDRGTDDGVRVDMPVIAAGGVVGRVVGQPAGRSAQVQLLIGRDAAVGAKLESSGAQGIIQGGSRPDRLLTLDYVSSLLEVRTGEVVLTSGTDTVFPPGYRIGTIEQADPPGPRRQILVRPAVDFSSLDLVLVLLVQPIGDPPAGGGPGGPPS